MQNLVMNLETLAVETFAVDNDVPSLVGEFPESELCGGNTCPSEWGC